jgi:hypothetical protein
MFKRTGLDKSNKNRVGVPDPKKFERTGKDTFVVHADGGNYFEGKVTDPKVQLKDSGKIFLMPDNIGMSNPCMECSNNKYHGGSKELCDSCIKYKNFKQKELVNAI